MIDLAATLTQEFKIFGLTDADARRSAFCALAYHAGWNAARIGRYLGVSRARVGQRIEKLHRYTHTHTEYMPVLVKLMKTATATESSGVPDMPVGFPASNWDDPAFALGLLQQLAA